MQLKAQPTLEYPMILEKKKHTLKAMLDEINTMMVDVLDASPRAQMALIERKQHEALLLGFDIAMSQIMSSTVQE